MWTDHVVRPWAEHVWSPTITIHLIMPRNTALSACQHSLPSQVPLWHIGLHLVWSSGICLRIAAIPLWSLMCQTFGIDGDYGGLAAVCTGRSGRAGPGVGRCVMVAFSRGQWVPTSRKRSGTSLFLFDAYGILATVVRTTHGLFFFSIMTHFVLSTWQRFDEFDVKLK